VCKFRLLFSSYDAVKIEAVGSSETLMAVYTSHNGEDHNLNIFFLVNGIQDMLIISFMALC
jgi:hypothetical protein